jgi:hypothetical protein
LLFVIHERGDVIIKSKGLLEFANIAAGNLRLCRTLSQINDRQNKEGKEKD